jgi:hypothetical protein
MQYVKQEVVDAVLEIARTNHWWEHQGWRMPYGIFGTMVTVWADRWAWKMP